ncbi:MAG: TonB-dependent receptor [Bacteroidaceae bacterium]|nr:TonB-dependent receptor [Bacteroidaceae bacterium]
MKRQAILLPLALIFSGVAAAQKTDSLRAVTLNPVVITGTGTYHKADNSPVAVRVISAKEIRDAHATTLQEALTRLTPNVTTHTNGMGTFVNFNGVSDDYVQILVNGKRVSGDDRWSRISMNNVKRIEVFSGAASSLYGSDAIAGVINIITDDGKEQLSASSSTKVLNHGRFAQHIDVDATAGKFSSRTSYTHQQADNWQVNPYQTFREGAQEVQKLTGRPMSTGFRSENISEQLDWNFSQQWSAYLRGDFYDNITQRPQGATYFTQKVTTDAATGGKTYTYSSRQAYTYDLHHRSYTVGGGARWVPNRNTHIYLDVYRDNFRSDYDYWQTATKEAYDETRKRTHYTNETLRGILRLASWNKLSAGAEFVQETLTSESDNIHGRHTQSYNLFAQDEVRIFSPLEGVVGLRYVQDRNFGAHFTPNAGLFFHLGGFRARASYAAGYRTPTLSQLYATDQAKTAARYTLYNPTLNPEKNHFWNLNLEYGNHWMTASLTGFVNQIRDMINYRTLTQAEVAADASLAALYAEGWTTIRQRDNIDHASLRGFSANVKFLIPGGVTLGGGYSFTDSEAKTQTLDQTTQTYVTAVSPVDKSVRNVGNVLAAWDGSWRRHHTNVTLTGHLQGHRYSSTYGFAEGYSQWDICVRHSVQMEQFVLEPGIGIENIFNERDTSPWTSNYSTVSPGRSFMVSLALKFDAQK